MTQHYFAVSGTDSKGIRIIGKSSTTSKKVAVRRATTYANKHASSGAMVITLRRVKIVRKPPTR